MKQVPVPPVRRHRRWVRRLVRLGAVLVIALAGLVAALRLALPWLVNDPQRVARFLSERLQAPVALAGSTAEVLGATPYLRLQGLRVGSGDQTLMLEEAELELDLAALVLPWRPVIADLRLRGLDIEIRRTPAGLEVRGLPMPRVGGFDALAWSERIGQLSLRGSRLRYTDPLQHTSWVVAALDARLQQRDGRLQLGARTGEGLSLTGHYDPDSARPLDVRVYGEAVQLPAEPVQLWGVAPISGTLQTDVRGFVNAQGGWELQGEVALRDAVLQGRDFALPEDGGSVQPHLRLPRVRIAGHAQGRNAGFSTNVLSVDLADQSGVLQLERLPGAGLRWAAQDLDLRTLADLATSSARLPEQMASLLYRLQPTGRVTRSAGWWNGPELWAEVQIADAGVTGPTAKVPSVAGLALDLVVDRQAAVFTLDAPTGVLDWPLGLRAPIPFAAQAQGALRWPAGEFEVEVDRYQVTHADATGQGHARLRWAAGQPPEMELAADVSGGSVNTAKHFWLRHRMPPRAIDWLDRALVAGKVTSGSLVLRGPLGVPHWPYREHQGRLEAQVRLIDGVVDYHAEWPKAEALQADVHFVNDGMYLREAKATLAGAQIRGQGRLPVFRDPILHLELAGAGDAGQWLDFLRRTPVGARHGSHLVGMQAQGEVQTQASLRLPLKRELGAPELQGQAELAGVTFTDSKWLLDFRDLRGQALFTRDGFRAEGLAVQTALGNQGRLDVAVGMTSRADMMVEAQLRGRFAPSDLFGAHEALTPLLVYLEGTSPWDLELEVPKGEGESRLLARSTLVGTALAMPPPLGKPAPEARELSLSMAFPLDTAPPLELRIGAAASARIRLPTPRQDFAGVLHLGAGNPTTELPARGLWIEGELPDDDPYRWLGIAGSFGGYGGDQGDMGFAGADVRLTREAGPAGRVRIWPDPDAPANWSVELDTRAAVGQLRWQALPGARSSVTADFSRLHLPDPEPAAAWPRSVLSPMRIPTLHVRAQDLQIGAMRLGALRLETFPAPGGLRIDRLETQAPHLELRGSGSWTQINGQTESALDLRFSADDLGQMLKSLGFSDPVQGGQTLATLQAAWNGSPADFGLERVHGTLDIWVGAGRFVDVSPGAGRLFGLLSLTALPRRLALDFRDFFQSGMAFDEIRGSFKLDEGNAWTQDLRIRAPSADIGIIGRTGVAARDYDQQMTVMPKLGGVLPLVGALAGGPGGAAAGLLAQSVFQGERAMMLREYRIEGSWDQPKIEREAATRGG